MRIRIRGPAGQSVLTLDDQATVKQLQAEIAEKTSIQSFEIKYSYPPKPLSLDQYGPETHLSDLGVKLNGEQLIVSEKQPSTSGFPAQGTETATANTSSLTNGQSSNASRGPDAASTSGFSFSGVGQAPSAPAEPVRQNVEASSSAPLALKRKQHTEVENDPPEVAVPEYEGTMVLRVMDDDNSCLFRAVGTCVSPGEDMMTELRSIIAQTIQEQKEIYSEVILEKKPDDYCRWIQTADAWGGAIELGILSQHFNVEICSIDVKTLRVDKFNEGRPTRCIVVYSGIHYDAIALSPSDFPYTKAYMPIDYDQKIFDAADPIILNKALQLCKVLQGKNYYTDTASFSIRCNTCRGVFVGEKGATEHAAQTGHYDFGEAG